MMHQPLIFSTIICLTAVLLPSSNACSGSVSSFVSDTFAPSPSSSSTTTTPKPAVDIFPADCGNNNYTKQPVFLNRVVGGVNAARNEFPFIVRLKITNSRGNAALCGGSIITNKLILTAAHCIVQDWESIVAVFADHVISAADPGEYNVSVTEAFVHPGYVTDDTHDNDFALLRLSTPLSFSSLQVQPVCLTKLCNDTSPPCNLLTIAGWGAIQESSRVASETLQKAAVPFVTRSKCQEMYDSYSVNITENMICAGVEVGGVDTCQGDSGGPLFCKSSSSGRYQLVGVTSFGIGCARASMVGVYSNVCRAVPWITDVANGKVTNPTTPWTPILADSVSF